MKKKLVITLLVVGLISTLQFGATLAAGQKEDVVVPQDLGNVHM
ncbi:hypothetical protein AWH56_26880 [Anaerobacillus isosaccharinicus]|uniref:Uncharacterized protein n=1 Tax=Anaerobacillus isosaccharinicus TaxID=1532552 RepID=A0AC62A4E1_9BACI|nr:hypothetical protein [Anaerobacillus isosaccharinicus]